MTVATKIHLATIWLDGCSGCHMSLFDTAQRLTEVAGPLRDHSPCAAGEPPGARSRPGRCLRSGLPALARSDLFPIR
jgi:hypothetical protein